MDEDDSTEIPGTAGASYPFFSPDGKWIAFFDSSGLKKVAVSGGSPLMIVPKATVFGGAVWADDGSIFFVPQVNTPVSRVSSAGGPVQAVTRFQPGDQNHRWPEALPGGKAIVFTVGSGTEWDSAKIVGERLDTGERKLLVDGGTSPRYIPGGYLVYARGNSLNAVSFDARALRVTGAPVEVARNVWLDVTGLSHFGFSRSGTLASVSPEAAGARVALSWIDRSGQAERINVDPVENFAGGGLSPDGGRAVLRLGNSIGVLELDRLSLRRLTLSGRTAWALWSADGRRVVFAMEKDRSYRIFSKAADDTGAEELIFSSDTVEYPAAVFPDGRRLLVLRAYPNGENAIVVRSIDPRDRGADTVLVRSRFVSGDVSVSPTSEAAVSPDGRWVAYTSFASGRAEVLVRPSSGEDREWQVSANGGGGPLWSPSGREIVYGSGSRLMAASIRADSEFSSGVPRVLFDRPEVRIASFAPDGQRFLGTVDPNYRVESKSDVTTGWFATIRRKIQEAKAP
jgi:serine/threonine-protein kinase